MNSWKLENSIGSIVAKDAYIFQGKSDANDKLEEEIEIKNKNRINAYFSWIFILIYSFFGIHLSIINLT